MHRSCSLLKAQSRVISYILIFCLEDRECVTDLKIKILYPKWFHLERFCGSGRVCMSLWFVVLGCFLAGFFLDVRYIVEVLKDSTLISGEYSEFA